MLDEVGRLVARRGLDRRRLRRVRISNGNQRQSEYEYGI
jgi:hypothetical protein